MKRSPADDQTDDGKDPVARFAAGEVTFGRAVELADTNVWKFIERLRERSVAWVGEEHTWADLNDL